MEISRKPVTRPSGEIQGFRLYNSHKSHSPSTNIKRAKRYRDGHRSLKATNQFKFTPELFQIKLFIQNLSILSLVATCYATSFWNRSDSSDSDDDVPYQGNIQGDMSFNGGTHVFGSTQKTNGRGGTQDNITRSINATGGANVTYRNVQTNMTQGNPEAGSTTRTQNNSTGGIHATNGATITYNPIQTTYSNGQQQWSQSHGRGVDVSSIFDIFFGASGWNPAPNVPTGRRDTPQSANTRGATASGIIYGGNGTSTQSVNVGKVSADSESKINVDPTQRFFGGGRGIQTTSIRGVQGPPGSININPVVRNN